jgi:predicted O-methyltransferase YrrM
MTVKNINIENALKIEGWMEPHDLEWLARHAAEAHTICEVGCWKGRSTTVLADNTPGIVYAVDTWLGSEEHNPPVQGLIEAFEANMRKYIVGGKVLQLRASSIDAAGQLAAFDKQFDMIFIDASHDYENVKADILAWRPLVAPGGLLCGHDAGHPPIMQALAEVLPDRLPNECSMWQVRL